MAFTTPEKFWKPKPGDNKIRFLPDLMDDAIIVPIKPYRLGIDWVQKVADAKEESGKQCDCWLCDNIDEIKYNTFRAKMMKEAEIDL